MAHDILIVDDEADIRMLIAGVLKDEGYATRDAADTAQTWAAIQARQPTLVILDIWLQGSGLEGIEILKQLRAEMPSVPVVMISGHGTIETAVEAIKIGAYDFLEKPFKSDRLLLVVLASSKPAPAADRSGRAHRQPRSDHRAAGIRQGGSCPSPACTLATGQRAVCPCQLRNDAAGAARNRIVRHGNPNRRCAAKGRHVRASAWRHALPR